jgi:hypothetical protein
MALGGSYASGQDSFAAAGADNTGTYGAQGANSIAIGRQNKTTYQYSTAIGVFSSSGYYSTALGYSATASGYMSFAIGGDFYANGATASAASSFAIGGGANTGTQSGKLAFSGSDSFGSGSYVSGAQFGMVVMRALTTSATPTFMYSGVSGAPAASTSNQIVLVNYSAMMFSIMIVARSGPSTGTASAAWKVEGLVRQDANAASTTLVNSIVTTISNVPGWAIAVTADTTNGGLTITVTGAASTNIRWVATVQTTEVPYP